MVLNRRCRRTVAVVIAPSLILFAGACSSDPGTSKSIFGKSDARGDCATLAASPLEGEAGHPGVPLDTIASGPAIAACRAAVEEDSSDARSWRRLHRAYIAGATYGTLGKTGWTQALSALRKAAALGDIPSMVDQTIIVGRDLRANDTIIADGERLLSDLRSRKLEEDRDIFAFGVLSASIGQLRASKLDMTIADPETDRFLNSFEKEPLEAFKAVTKKGGGMPAVLERSDFIEAGYCDIYHKVCMLFSDATVSSANAELFLAIASELIANGYRRADRAAAFTARGENVPDSLAGGADAARAWARQAEKLGEGRHARAIAEIYSAADTLEAYSQRQHAAAEATAQRSREEVWLAIGATLLASLATSNVNNDNRDPAKQWAEEQRERDCNAAFAAKNWESSLTAIDRGYYAAQRAGC